MKLSAQKNLTVFESSGGKKTGTYHEVISWWQKLDKGSDLIKMMEMGPTDAGFPLHLIIVSKEKDFDIPSLKKKKKNIVFVLNGIHPGEPDGIDASMLLVRDIVEKKYPLPGNIVLALIPVYNIGGALNRSKNFRIDQNGPEEKGFRGNSQNLDLNRDYIKADSKEALSFTRIFHMLDPDVFVDNHVSNGADYQHVMTLIASQHNKLGGKMGAFMNKTFEPGIYKIMKEKGWDLVPYVNHFGATPEKGWTEFWDSPRYSSGFASLWNTFAFVPETHMLKPYPQRVQSTKDLLKSFIEFTSENADEIRRLREEAKASVKKLTEYAVKWELDTSKSSKILFKGYASGRKPSEVSGLQRLYYDRNKPFEKQIPFYNHYKQTSSIKAPKAYIIPQGWWKVIDRLKANNIQIHQLTKDTTIQVEVYSIMSYQSSPRPYEGHHPNSNVQVSTDVRQLAFRKGDYYIPFNQIGNKFLIETLEPTTEDSYFFWNFFDPILGQKEGFSDYVFEETATDFLSKHPEVRAALEEKKKTDTTFAKNGRAQLSFVFQNSPYFERAYQQYPVYRVMN